MLNINKKCCYKRYDRGDRPLDTNRDVYHIYDNEEDKNIGCYHANLIDDRIYDMNLKMA